MVKLSICCPTIRPDNIKNLYNSIVNNFHQDFELILCGPKEPSISLPDNIVFIQDYGSPNRAQSIAAHHATGQIITTMADDGIYLSKSISRAVIKLENWERTHGNSYKHVVSYKYVEGNMPWWMMTIETGLLGYSLATTYLPDMAHIPNHWIHFNGFYMYRDYFNELGGFDCAYETPCVASADLAVRAQNNGCTTELMDEPATVASHQPNLTGDHGPIHLAMSENDLPLIKHTYGNEGVIQDIIEPDSWRKVPEKWQRRFA